MTALDNLGLALAVKAVFDEERECESPQHSTRPEDHLGTAQWYVHVKHECGYNTVHAFCDRIKRVLDDPKTVANCSGCGKEVMASEAVQSMTRIGAER